MCVGPEDGPQGEVGYTLPSGISYPPNCAFIFTPTGSGGGSIVTEQCQNLSVVDPAYQVVSILYAPPGDLSNDAYGQSTTNGTLSSFASSFVNGTSVTFNQGFMAGLFGATVGDSYGHAGGTTTADQFQEQFTDATVLENASLKGSKDALNHNNDLFVIWLNSEVQVTSNGNDPVSYNVGLQPASDGETSQPDIIRVPAYMMEPGSNGLTSVDFSWLNPQHYQSGNTTVYMPGLAAICKNVNWSEYNSRSCTTADQCGCQPSDFAPILAEDPLLTYSGTDNPMNADTSGAKACLSPGLNTDCRYIVVPDAPDSQTAKAVLLEGPGSSPTSFTQTDSYAQTQTLGGFDQQTMSATVKVQGLGFSLTHTDTMTIKNSESTGTSSGAGNSMSIYLNTDTAKCGEWISLYEDTVFHTFVMQEPGGNTGCSQ